MLSGDYPFDSLYPTSALNASRECDSASCQKSRGRQVLHRWWFREISHRKERMEARDPHWLWNPGHRSPEDQNRGISGPTKYVLQKLKTRKPAGFMQSCYLKCQHASSCFYLFLFPWADFVDIIYQKRITEILELVPAKLIYRHHNFYSKNDRRSLIERGFPTEFVYLKFHRDQAVKTSFFLNLSFTY